MAKTLRRQWRILLALREQPRTVGSLARQFGVSKATAQRDVETLAQVFAVTAASDEKHKQRRVWSAHVEAA